jgi:hypothetical protein
MDAVLVDCLEGGHVGRHVATAQQLTHINVTWEWEWVAAVQ